MNKLIVIGREGSSDPLTLDVLEQRVTEARAQEVPGDAVLEVVYEPGYLTDVLAFKVPMDPTELSVGELISQCQYGLPENRSLAWAEVQRRLVGE